MSISSDNYPSNNQQAAIEARYKALLSASTDVIYSLSADWSEMRELDGRGFLKDASRPTTGWMEDNVHPDEMDRVKAAIAYAIQHKEIFEMEHKVLRADRTPGWAHSKAVPVLDKDGEIVEWVGIAKDTTARKAFEEELQQARLLAEQQKRVYETIASGTPDLMYVWDLNYRFTYANAALLTMWGKTWETAIGKTLIENGYEPWHAEMHENEIDRIIKDKKPIRGEVAFPHAILGRRIYDYILTPVLNEEGEVEAVAGTTRDVTDRKHWEETLAKSAHELQAINEEMSATNEELASANEELVSTNEELASVNHELILAQRKIEAGQADIMRAEKNLRIAIEAAGLGTFFLNMTDGIFEASEKLKEFFGYLPEENFTYEAGYQQVNPEYREDVRKGVEQAMKDDVPFDMEYPIVGYHDGKTRWVRGIGEILHDDGKVYFTGVIHEITEKKLDEIRKNDFIGMVSHELKTPLTSMKGYIQMLTIKLKKQEDEMNLGILDKANTQISKMTGMINGFLNISRLESGKIHIDAQVFDLALLIKEVEEETFASINSHDIQFAPVETTFVNVDRDKIGQVIHNLISNAVKYSPAGSTINIACVTLNGRAQVSVRDKGMGIKADDLSKIFDRYYRVSGNHMHSISGFGIGLYLCAEIIKRHQGNIWAESDFGNGSTFNFNLPLA